MTKLMATIRLGTNLFQVHFLDALLTPRFTRLPPLSFLYTFSITSIPLQLAVSDYRTPA